MSQRQYKTFKIRKLCIHYKYANSFKFFGHDGHQTIFKNLLQTRGEMAH